MTTEADWAAARELCRVLSEEFDPTEHRADATKCNWCRPCAAALAEAREGGERSGAEKERRACWDLAREWERDADTRCHSDSARAAASACSIIAGAIAARGPMDLIA